MENENIKTLSCRVVTHMFLSGANPGTAEFRTPGFKAAIRFWWRALQAESDIKTLSEQEDKIFGNGGTDAVKSSFSLNVSVKGKNSFVNTGNELPKQTLRVTSKGKEFPINILDYLAYGSVEYKKEQRTNIVIRSYIPAGTDFSLRISKRNAAQSHLSDRELEDLIFLSGYVGGIGSRSRNGFGKFSFSGSLNFEERLIDIVSASLHKDPVSYTAFSNQTRIYKMENTAAEWDKALGDLGKIYREVRISLEQRHRYEKRVYIAKPYIVKNDRINIHERHAKPYFLTVVPEGEKYRGYLIYMPYDYYSGAGTSKPNRFNNTTEYYDVNNEFNDKLAKKLKNITPGS